MEKLGDSIMNELETAEDEVCRAWGKFMWGPCMFDLKEFYLTT